MGSAAVAIGSAVVVCTEYKHQATTVVLVGGICGAIMAVIAVIMLALTSTDHAILVGVAGAAPGFAAVRGVATEQTQRWLGTGLVILSLSPVVVNRIRYANRVGGLGAGATYMPMIIFLVYTAVLSYSVSRLGQIAR